MSYEEEDTCHLLTEKASAIVTASGRPYHEEENTCHMRRRIHVICYCEWQALS
jgi:hypothetical protein